MEGLDALPLEHISQASTIRMVPEISNNKPGVVTLGRAYDLGFAGEIQLSRKALATPIKADKFLDTLTHEVGHTTDYSRQPFGLAHKHSERGLYGEGPYITGYAETNHKEDLAESYEEFHRRPENLRKTTPEKYRDMEELNRGSFLENLVDRKEFRETGKYIGELLGPNRLTRNVVEGAAYGTSILQTGAGLSQWVGSAESGDPMTHASGILNTAAGAAFWSGVAPLVGMGIQGAHQALKSSVKRGELTPQEVEATVALPVRPLEGMFGREPVRLKKEHRPGKVVAVAAGGALGATAGSLVGPYAGVMAGYHLAGALGGTIGMVAGGLAGFYGGSALGGRLGGAIANALS